VATVRYMSMSLDGFIAGPNEGPGNGLGDGGHRLHEWVLPGAEADHKAISDLGGVNGQVVDEFMATGAVVAGRGTFEPAGGWGGDHHDGVPIWVFSRREPGIDVSRWASTGRWSTSPCRPERSSRAAGRSSRPVVGAAITTTACRSSS